VVSGLCASARGTLARMPTPSAAAPAPARNDRRLLRDPRLWVGVDWFDEENSLLIV
jgi:4-amino-4-deoxy-L-arabinose transferase-like glycosyltransferase